MFLDFLCRRFSPQLKLQEAVSTSLSKDFDVGFELPLRLYISEAGNRRLVSPSALSFCCCCSSFHRACVYSNFISA